MARDANSALYVMSVAADLAGVHPQTLRLYERKGLVDPARSAGAHRRYSDADLARLGRIAELTSAGVNLEGVRRVLELEDLIAGLRDQLDRSRVEAAEAAETVEERTHHQRRREVIPDGAEMPWHVTRPPLCGRGTDGVDGGGRGRRRIS